MFWSLIHVFCLRSPYLILAFKPAETQNSRNYAGVVFQQFKSNKLSGFNFFGYLFIKFQDCIAIAFQTVIENINPILDIGQGAKLCKINPFPRYIFLLDS